MKTILSSFLLLFSIQLSAQTVTDRYIELVAYISDMGTANIEYVRYPKDKMGKPDSLINAKQIDSLVNVLYKKRESTIAIINEFAKNGWELTSATYQPTSATSSYRGTMSYYLRKRFQN